MVGDGGGGIPYVVEGVYGSGTGYSGVGYMVWYGGMGYMVWVCGYLIFENNSLLHTTIRHRFDDQTTSHIVSLKKILSIQLRFSCDDIR